MTDTVSPRKTAHEAFLGSRNVDAGLFARLSEGITVADASPGAREPLPTLAPFTGERLASVPQCTDEDVREAAHRAREAQEAWARRSIAERARVFLRYHDLVMERQELILDLMQLETGKARGHAFEEVLDAAITARYYARSAARHLKTRRRQGALPGLTLAREERRPKGLVALISPWNYPFTLAASDAVPALLAGNAVLLKPDRKTSFTALLAVRLLREAGLPPDLFAVVTGEGEPLGEPLIRSADYVGFTGSTEVGRHIARLAGEALIGCTLELGGKNASLVLDDADLDRAVEGTLRGCFANAGQLCISTERLFVQAGIYSRFVERFAERVRSMKLGGGLRYGPEMGSLISAEQLATVERHVGDAVGKGARVLAGGRARPDLGPFFYEPTVLEGARAGMELFADETFGPVVSVSRFTSVDEAVERANDSPYGLNASVWTRDARRGYAVARRLEAGTVNVNEAYAAAWASTDAPMGGMKTSGLGRRHGAEGILKYTEAQTVAVQRLFPVTAPANVPGERYARVMTGALRALKAASRLPGLR
ncbi:NAD-dependent aldehyde dehydrogenase [Rubrobacter radiotolerans]|uniref:NAD-dependent aldehyde dehydrogenase n=1 Tax=Rubrobacter radiotolerans TaxID=42256 RepID=A0A023X5C5_RUBRA|nr:succinic semialdehyde dehydrogenase [Rubrobacter radiotolerans]AHY47657.1 NAD-dependent aldehyde dehydrogenase [Rubrobacter radiotolerans]MDX5895060.1 succinic semialdehyde dehydrogenase [Rubrobacter radiotolerans]SMC07367.1 succinate-semialdehyde dehydrogenase / glutarate-semialdehyde dehydrogenase [Rubrobacter radiotolerans DSM 5868]